MSLESPDLPVDPAYCVLLHGSTTCLPIAWLKPSPLLEHLACLEWAHHPPGTDWVTPTLTVDLSPLIIQFVVEYLALRAYDPTTKKKMERFMTRVMNRDKLMDEVAAGLTTLEDEHIRTENLVQAVCDSTRGTPWEVTLQPFTYPALPRCTGGSDYQKTARQLASATLLGNVLFYGTRREYVFDLMDAAVYLGITHLSDLCANHINQWRRKRSLLTRTWSMARHTRFERVAAVEMVVAFRRRECKVSVEVE